MSRWPLVSLGALFACLVGGASLLALSRPLCCADDAAHAVIARNVAFGLGYSDTLGHNVSTFGFTPFDPVIGTGPTVILPAALTIWIFGNEAAVPGLTAVAMWSLLMSVLFLRLHRNIAAPRRSAAAAAVFLLLCATLSPFSAGQWFALLGEVPAILLVMLSFSFVAAAGASRRSDAIGGLCLGLALAAKLLMAVYALPILVVLLWRREHALRERLVRASLFCAIATLPLVSFELWKLCVLPWPVYLEYSSRTAGFIHTVGLAGSGPSLSIRVADRLAAYQQTFGLPLLAWVPMIGVAWWVVLRSKDVYAVRFTSLLIGGAAVHLGYWLVLSTGNVRYALPATLVLAAAVSMRFVARAPVLAAGAYVCLLTVALAAPARRLPFYATFYSSEVMAADESDAELVADFLVARRGSTIVLTQWWATAAALEYASATPWIFDGFHRYAAGAPGSGALVAYSDHFVDRGDTAFLALLEACGPPVLVKGPFKVHQCMEPRPPTSGDAR